MAALIEQGNYEYRFNKDGMLWVVEINRDPLHVSEGEKWLGPVKIGALAVDQFGNIGAITIDGEQRVADYAEGLPFFGTSTTGANAYATVVVVGRRCRNLHVTVATFGAILSLDGGITDHFWIAAAETRQFDRLNIPAGSVISGRNAAAGSNYANLAISAW